MTEKKPFYWLNEESVQFLKRGYLLEGTEPLERIRQIADEFEKRDKTVGIADKFYDYMSRGWISLSTPVWCNFGLDRGFGISCFGTEIQDYTADILRGAAEIGMMSKFGGGTASWLGNLRPRGSSISGGGTSNGAVSFLEIFESVTDTISQNSARRGSFAAYLPIDHGDIEEFLTLRSEESAIQNLSMGITIPYGWMQSMIDGDRDKRKLWAKVLQKRTETGYPYIFFDDNVNNHKPKVYKDKHIKIKTSQLCSEILLSTSDKESFVCCLSSVNLLHFDDWKDTDLVEVMMRFLDVVMEEFIEKASKVPFFEKAVEFAKNQNAVGLGVLSLHSYLQSKMIPFEGMAAKMELNKIFKLINDKSLEASKKLASEKGEPKLLESYGERFTTRLSVAPTTSSSFILGQVSPSIEPLNSNYFMKDVAKGKFPYKNPILEELLEVKGKNNTTVWKSILEQGGSVQHLDFLTEHEKNVFKTFGEISQLEIVQNVSIIQKYIDQGISLNLMIHPDTPVKDINTLMIEGWKLGIKTFYYQRSSNVAQELGRNILTCASCES